MPEIEYLGAANEAPLWVLWVVGKTSGTGAFTPKIFSTLRCAKSFVGNLEVGRVEWHDVISADGFDVLVSQAQSKIHSGARWLAAPAYITEVPDLLNGGAIPFAADDD